MDSFKLSVTLWQQPDYWLTRPCSFWWQISLYVSGVLISLTHCCKFGMPTWKILTRQIGANSAWSSCEAFWDKKLCTTYRYVPAHTTLNIFVHLVHPSSHTCIQKGCRRVWFIILRLEFYEDKLSKTTSMSLIIVAKRLFQSSSPQLLPALLFCVVLGWQVIQEWNWATNFHEKPKARSRSPTFTNSF